MELIERDKLLQAFQDRELFNVTEKHLSLIRDAPVVEAVKVVKCGECTKIQTPECLLCSFDIDGYCTGGPPSDFYCADGKRRESEGT